MQMVNPDIADYAHKHTTDESKAVQKLVEESARELAYIDMLSGKMVGQLLAMLARISGAQNVLEIGTFTGYSALRMAAALPEDGSIITCDTNERYAKIARGAFENNEHGHKIELRMGTALRTIGELDQTFDFIFLDADKNNYPTYYRKVIPILNSGGLLVVDNVLWDGKVLELSDEKARNIDALNTMIANDERVEQVMLTVRDGLTIARKK